MCKTISIPPLDIDDPAFNDKIIDQIDSFGVAVLNASDQTIQELQLLLKQSHCFFNQSFETKIKFLGRESGGPGYFPVHFETAIGFDSADPKEFWHSQESSFEHDSPLWPEDMDEWKTISQKMYATSKILCEVVKNGILQAINVEQAPDFSSWSTLRQILYPNITQLPEGAYLAYPHEGIQFLGLQWPGTQKGLEFFHDDLGWFSIDGIDRYITINIGAMLEAYSNHRFKATRHRVRKVGDYPFRLASVFFYHIDPSTLLTLDGKEVLAGNWLASRIKNISANN